MEVIRNLSPSGRSVNVLEIHEPCEHTNVCVGGCISKEVTENIIQLQGDHKSSKQQKQMIV